MVGREPYELGINWKCGQEISFRTFAWLFGLYAFRSPLTTDDRIFMLIKIYITMPSVLKRISILLSKLCRTTTLLAKLLACLRWGPFSFLKRCEKIVAEREKVLEQEGLKQIYEDGSYLQHSNNYHRLMLQDYAWCYRLAERNGVKFTSELTNRLRLAVDFLYQMQDEATGMTPNYGSNDGALVFPLSACDYLDYRPQINTINYIINGKSYINLENMKKIYFGFVVLRQLPLQKFQRWREQPGVLLWVVIIL